MERNVSELKTITLQIYGNIEINIKLAITIHVEQILQVKLILKCRRLTEK